MAGAGAGAAKIAAELAALADRRYERVGAKDRAALARFYLDNRDRVNNWDLVDASARIMLSDRLRAPGAGKLERLPAPVRKAYMAARP